MHHLIIPGLNNSGPAHWQSFWAKSLSDTSRVVQRNWDDPKKSEWMETLDQAIAGLTSDTILIGHSLGTVISALWLTEVYGRGGAVGNAANGIVANPGARFVKGAFLVSASDADSVDIIKDFAPMPLQKMPVPTWLICSEDDPFVSMERSKQFAEAWGAHLECVGALGHINAKSNLGEWEQGRKLLAEFEKQF